MARRRNRRKEADIGGERIRILFGLAEKSALEGDVERASEYVRQARDISMRVNNPIPKDLKNRMCGKCHSYLAPAVNCRVRLDSVHKRVCIKCLACGRVSYHPYVRERKG